MYYPVGWNKVLKVNTETDGKANEIIIIKTNQEKNLLIILTPCSLHLWNTKPPVEIVSHRRNSESIVKYGPNKLVAWKPDSSVIVILTEYNQLLFYQVRRRIVSSTSTLLNRPLQNFYNDTTTLYNIKSKSSRKSSIGNKNETPTAFSDHHESIPAISLLLSGKLDLSYLGVSCLMSAEEELIIASDNGDIYGVLWHGIFDERFPFTIGTKETSESTICDLKFSTVLRGFSAVFTSGKVAFIPLSQPPKQSSTSEAKVSEKLNLKTNHLTNVNNAVCTAINHKYKLIAYGLKDSRVLVCNLSDSSATMTENHILELPFSKYPHIKRNLGQISAIKYSTDNLAIVSAWKFGGFAVWSVFGSFLFYSGQWEQSPGLDLRVKSVSWGIEGYHLFVCVKKQKQAQQDHFNLNSLSTESPGLNDLQATNERESSAISSCFEEIDEILVISMARSALLLSPNSTCLTDSVLLLSEDNLYIGPSTPHCHKFDHWEIVNIEPKYLAFNFPIRYSTTNRDCKIVVIAGNLGFAILDTKEEIWTIPSKCNFSVTSDLIWFNEYLIFSCYNLDTMDFELRAYNSQRIEGNFHTCQISQEVISMSLFENRILALYADGTMAMFMLNLRKLDRKTLSRANSSSFNSNNTKLVNGPNKVLRKVSLFETNNNSIPTSMPSSNLYLHIAPIEGLVVSNLIVNPFCITSITLTRLHFKNDRSDDSILLNACGKLFLLEREILSSMNPSRNLNKLRNNSEAISKESTELERKLNEAKVASNSVHYASASLRNDTSINKSSNSLATFKSVSMIATNVEHYWISPDISNASELSYFKKSLWLYCGGASNNLEVWFPLLVDKNNPPSSHQYTPNRIMLHIKCDVYPIAIKSSTSHNQFDCCDDTIILGAENDVLLTRGMEQFCTLPYYTVKRQCQIYLHRILLELLRRNLGYYAQKISESCQKLPYFAHSFELLLHEVLEEEASSPRPIPDPMLPQVVEFIRQSPVYLETVVHCARKSDLSIWPHLFSVVGNPQRLFQECLDKGFLETAASCLMILQSFDRLTLSQQMVKDLIAAAKTDFKYENLIKDLETFSLRAELDLTGVSSIASSNNINNNNCDQNSSPNKLNY